MKSMRISDVLVLSPELWVGMLVDYDETFNTAFKNMVECKAFDRGSKSWWFPISYLPFVKQLVREHHVADDKRLDNAHTVIQAELNRRQFVKVNTDVDGVLAPGLTAAFAVLGLHPTAPRLLIEWAIMFWRAEAGKLSIPQTRLMEAEEAYRVCCGGLGS